MASDTKTKTKDPAPKPAGFDKGPQDFFRASTGMNKSFQSKFKPQRDFTGFRRGSR